VGKRGQERGQHSVYDVKETISHISDESYAPERSCFCEIYASMYVAQLFRMVFSVLCVTLFNHRCINWKKSRLRSYRCGCVVNCTKIHYL